MCPFNARNGYKKYWQLENYNKISVVQVAYDIVIKKKKIRMQQLVRVHSGTKPITTECSG